MSNARKLLSAYGGKITFAHFDTERPDGYIPETVQECEPIIERAKFLSEQTPGKDLRHVGFIPGIVWDQACREGWQNDKAKWKQWLNDPANRAFRTWPGRV